MKISFGIQLEARPVDDRPNTRRQNALSCALALALIWAGGAAPALAASFGAFALVAVYDPGANEQADDFFAIDPASATLPLVLIPESTVYANGATSTATSLTRFVSNGSGSGNAAADLAVGTLRAFASSSSLVPNTGINAYARAGFADTLTPLTSGLLHFDFIVTGTVTGNNGGGGGWFSIDGNVVLGTRGEADYCLVPGPNACAYAFDIQVTAGVPVQFSAAIEAFAVNSTVDLSNTATLRATGVSFTSDSGVFLTAVPEPSSLLLLLVTGLVGLTGRRGVRLS